MDTGNPSGCKNQGKKPASCKGSKEPMKVKYISSPVMVSAKSAAEFKAIVQELTGKDSSDEHHHRSPEAAAGNRVNAISVPNQETHDCGVTNQKLGYGAEQVQGSSRTIETNGLEEDGFWNFSDSCLSRCEFPYG